MRIVWDFIFGHRLGKTWHAKLELAISIIAFVLFLDRDCPMLLDMGLTLPGMAGRRHDMGSHG